MAKATLAGIRACVFDAYGTLFDARDTLGLNARWRRIVWCNRCDRRRENLPGQPAREIRALAELLAVLGA
jgi:FMN phosphatase YigB (HAD superfamily)